MIDCRAASHPCTLINISWHKVKLVFSPCGYKPAKLNNRFDFYCLTNSAKNYQFIVNGFSLYEHWCKFSNFCQKVGSVSNNLMTQIWVRMSTTLMQNLESFLKTQTLNAGTSVLIPQRNHLALHLQFCFFIRKNTPTTKLSPWVV